MNEQFNCTLYKNTYPTFICTTSFFYLQQRPKPTIKVTKIQCNKHVQISYFSFNKYNVCSFLLRENINVTCFLSFFFSLRSFRTLWDFNYFILSNLVNYLYQTQMGSEYWLHLTCKNTFKIIHLTIRYQLNN